MSNKTILMIDDEVNYLEMIKTRLSNDGYDVLTESNPIEGIKLARQHLPDLILLDVLMPQMNGREVCKKIKEDSATAHIPIIFLSAKDSKDDIEAELSLGAEGHIVKPFEKGILLEEIKNTIEKHLSD